MATLDPIRILVLHANPIMRAGLLAILRETPRHDVRDARMPDEGKSPLQLEGGWSPDVVVTDLRTSLLVAGETVGRPVRTRIMTLAVDAREWEIRRALEAGIQGYLLADSSPDELSAGVQAVSRGMHHLSPPVAARLADSHSRERLSAREEEVLRLVIAGLCNKDICRRMKIALGTVKSHLKSAFAKMKVESRTGAIAEARRSGLLPLDEPELLRQSDTRVAEQSPRPAVPINTHRQPQAALRSRGGKLAGGKPCARPITRAAASRLS